MGCLGGPLSRLWSLPGPAVSGTAGVMGGISEAACCQDGGWQLLAGSSALSGFGELGAAQRQAISGRGPA